ncbi:inositol monophosphatase family protein [Ferrovum sp. PN-J185]|uniref:inositol monophosphatase family protein n=1 Tax=Ferrovum sp. PN-J185 TaxID=1356306 RepID=UPI000798B673|nr:inositol monophosphatase family protein [Ferrovum sp. PN-J185]KXW55864.1 fructose-1,6-bisphosphatase/inositol-1-monophosphatase [Ferrovum sp. PN-J185]MCC6068747.1 inositol monophosphatase family protein [Ferrovum sp. PN-J185]MDE1891848.1 inositol monophosphatase family protein [Betaproteobacteria bacterium]MDE2056917.1 inositol monophosphatase family protein [Betaproteobacteria bacterium]
MRLPLINLIKSVAKQEVVPRYHQALQHRKLDGSICTEADLCTQSVLSTTLLSLKHCPILGEEMSTEEQLAIWQSHDDYLWCIDPIDGTSNFANGIDYFAISVALLYQGIPVLGVVYNPITDEAYSAEQGGGAWCNDTPLTQKPRSKALHEAIASVDFKRLPKDLAQHLSIQPPYASQRNFGACALEWCHVAAGKFDVYLHGGQKLWDYAAGSLILKEAGGVFLTLNQEPFWHQHQPWQRSVIAAHDAHLFDQWLNWFKSHSF